MKFTNTDLAVFLDPNRHHLRTLKEAQKIYEPVCQYYMEPQSLFREIKKHLGLPRIFNGPDCDIHINDFYSSDGPLTLENMLRPLSNYTNSLINEGYLYIAQGHNDDVEFSTAPNANILVLGGIPSPLESPSYFTSLPIYATRIQVVDNSFVSNPRFSYVVFPFYRDTVHLGLLKNFRNQYMPIQRLMIFNKLK